MSPYLKGATQFFTLFSLGVVWLAINAGQAWAINPPGWESLQKAKDYREAGKLPEAVIELKNALQKNPDNPEARLLLGQSYVEMNKGAEAEKELRRAREAGLEAVAVLVPLGEALLLQGKNEELLEQVTLSAALSGNAAAEVNALRGDAHLAEGNVEAAAKAFQQSLTLQPQLPRALLGQARLALINRDFKTARSNIDQALAAAPGNGIGWSLLGDLESSLGNHEKADEAYGKAMQNSYEYSLVQLKRALVRIELDDFAGAASDVSAVKKLAPDYPGLLYTEGLLNFRRGDAAKAQAAFEQVVGRQPGNLQAVFYLGAANYAQGNLEQAESYLGRFVTAYPRARGAGTLLGMTRLQRGDFAGVETVLRPLLTTTPDDPQILATLGKALVAQGKSEEGNKYLRRSVALQPDSATDRVDLAVSMLRLGQEEAGIKELAAVVESNPNLRKADIVLIREYLQAAEFDKALTAAERLQGKWPNSPAPLLLKGMAYAGKGDVAKSRSSFEEALKLQPGEPSAASNLAALELREGRSEKARGYYQQVLKHNPGHLQTLLNLARMESELGNEAQARTRMNEAIRANPEALQPRILLSRVQLGEGKPLMALATLRDVQDKHAGNPSLWVALGQARFASGDAAGAIQDFRKLVEAQPTSAQAHYLLANAYGVNKDQAGLRKELFKGLELQPDHPMADRGMALYASLAPNLKESAKRVAELKKLQPDHPQVADLEAQLALKEKDYGKAIEIYSRLHKRFPERGGWVLGLAGAQWLAGKHDDHFATLNRWVKENPQDVAAQYMLANSYLQLERTAEASEAFARVVKLAPENVMALNNLAWLMREKDPQAALVHAEKARKLAPDDVGVMDTLGVVLIRKGETARAVDLLQEAAKKRPDMLTVKYHLATALVQQGKREEARKELRRVLQQQREFPEWQAAQALLTELGN